MHIDISASTVAEAFYWGEVENELRAINMDYFFRKDSDRESCMEAIEEKRREKIYPHLTCEEECKKRG